MHRFVVATATVIVGYYGWKYVIQPTIVAGVALGTVAYNLYQEEKGQVVA